jgi:hypothetical protein
VTSKKARGLLGLAATLALATIGATAPVQASMAGGPATSLPPTGAGIDISFPQCSSNSHVDLPASIPFAVIGVNGGVASNSNRCLESEYNSAILLAGTTDQPHASLYVNTGNPALAATWWPKDDRTQSGTAVQNPDGTCAHAAGPACAYVYGYSMAQADYRRAHKKLTRVPSLWWLDVETTNTWQADVGANAASLTGMVDYFQSKALTVGIYSTSFQWKKIAGVTPATSHLAGLMSWLAGGSYVGAPADCEKGALTPNGRVAMVQYVTHLDNDYSCRPFSAAVAAISPSMPSTVGSSLIALPGAWAPEGVAYSYQWNRNGAAIQGATSNTYTTTSSDIDANLTVTITGMKSGYSTTSKSSAATSVLAKLTPQPARLTGTFATGHTLTVTTGAWAPQPVTLSYAWYRDGTLVTAGHTATSYVLTSADVGQYVTATVTGSEPGYASATESAMSPLIGP